LVFQAKYNITPVGGQPDKKPVPQILIGPGAGRKSRQRDYGQAHQYPPPLEKSKNRKF
jgi:hypothetical protein